MRRLFHAGWCALLGATAAPAVACSDSEPPPPTAAPQDAGVDVEVEAGGCAPGEALVGGACVAAGVPAGRCGDGFESDRVGGCTPVLPSAACPRGQMAVPGEAACRPIAPCGDPPWGDIPVDEATVFVDSAYPGTDSDGTAERPWTTLQDAIIAAPAGATLALAEGVYAESAYIATHPLEIWGRCPDLVEIGGVDQFEGLLIDVAGTEVHTVAFTSEASFGLLVGGEGIVLDRVWVHDTGDIGVLVAGFLGTTDVTISGSLIEAATAAGISVIGARAELDGSVIRAGVAHPEFGPGRGLDVEDDPETATRSEVSLRRSVIEGNRESGVVVFGSDFTMDASVVRDTAADGNGRFGIGVAVQSSGAVASQATLTASVVARSHMVGVSAVGSAVVLDRCVIADTRPQESDAAFGDGVSVLPAGTDATLDATQSRIAGNARSGVANFGSVASLAGTAFDCNVIHLDGETLGGPYTFQDVGGNACRCGAEPVTCQVVTTNIAAPAALP